MRMFKLPVLKTKLYSPVKKIPVTPELVVYYNRDYKKLRKEERIKEISLLLEIKLF